ncbi:hypothetical protein FBU59_006142 [Linderina macrospora]|uniref:Uncharacterized protein n=1 Tax=Linderina macrospora TaxID=4868 RepID=A0ACC1J0N8_9FUNG|nr:hypothetical protein FBU59_006142 [Linderina macrospora]
MTTSLYSTSPSTWGHMSLSGFPSDTPIAPSPEMFAARAKALLKSIHARYRQLCKLSMRLQSFKANPLGGAMCEDIEYRMHQLALMIRSQMRDLARVEAEFAELPLDELRQKLLQREVPSFNESSAIRNTILKEVIEFYTNDVPRIEQSSMFQGFTGVF